jgi:transcriptional regulator NrdR family protein
MTEKPLQGPGSRLKPLACGKCGVPDSGQTISKNPPPNDRPLERTLRRYRCKVCAGEYITVETRSESALTDLLVVSRGPWSRAPRNPYSREMLATDLYSFIPKGLSPAERETILARIERRIEAHATELRRKKPEAIRFEITVDDLVELALSGFQDAARDSWHGHRDGQERVRVAHAQYALATLGSHDRKGNWKSAAQFVEWLQRSHPGLFQRRNVSVVPPADPGEAIWHRHPPESPVTIQQVVKNTRYEREDPPRRPKRDFDEHKLKRSIARALHGRDPKGVRAANIYDFVTLGLQGQWVVRSSQLSSAVAAALRGIDEIAYLRWVALGKELDLGQLLDEALGLMEYPSPRLKFHGRRDSAEPGRQPAVAQDGAE